MDDINVSIGLVVKFMSDISTSVTEQTHGVEQVNQALTQMDEITQQNAALVEEAAASVASLEQQAHTLDHSVSVFKLSAAYDQAPIENELPFDTAAPPQRLVQPVCPRPALGRLPPKAKEKAIGKHFSR